jgi:hypothetical protein
LNIVSDSFIFFAGEANSLVQQQLLTEAAIVCSSLVSIDDVPVSSLFNLDKDPKGNSIPNFNYVRPPSHIKEDQVKQLFNYLIQEMDHLLIPKLYQFYTDTVDPNNKILNPNSESEETGLLWRCPTCEYVCREEERINANKERLPYFCKLDGTQMELLDDTADPDGDDLPLS